MQKTFAYTTAQCNLTLSQVAVGKMPYQLSLENLREDF